MVEGLINCFSTNINYPYFSNINTWSLVLVHIASQARPSSTARLSWRRPYLRSAAPAELFTIGSVVKRDRTAAIKPVNRRDEKLKKLERENEAKRKRVSRESIWLSVKGVPYIAFKKLAWNTIQVNCLRKDDTKRYESQKETRLPFS